jgi:hypothetical protein
MPCSSDSPVESGPNGVSDSIGRRVFRTDGWNPPHQGAESARRTIGGVPPTDIKLGGRVGKQMLSDRPQASPLWASSQGPGQAEGEGYQRQQAQQPPRHPSGLPLSSGPAGLPAPPPPVGWASALHPGPALAVETLLAAPRSWGRASPTPAEVVSFMGISPPAALTPPTYSP